jgi:hypothetical protein
MHTGQVNCPMRRLFELLGCAGHSLVVPGTQSLTAPSVALPWVNEAQIHARLCGARLLNTQARSGGSSEGTLFHSAVSTKNWAMLVEKAGAKLHLRDSLNALDALSCIHKPQVDEDVQSRAKHVIKCIKFGISQMDFTRLSRVLRIFGKVASINAFAPVMEHSYTPLTISTIIKRVLQIDTQDMHPPGYIGFLVGLSRLYRCALPLLPDMVPGNKLVTIRICDACSNGTIWAIKIEIATKLLPYFQSCERNRFIPEVLETAESTTRYKSMSRVHSIWHIDRSDVGMSRVCWPIGRRLRR